ncbi:hypothetical protein SLS57_010963 [Botryosphaeria dothidea]
MAPVLLAKVIADAIYNIYFHPLSKFPGPRHAAAWNLIYVYHMFRGNAVHWIDSVHKQHGEIVRIGPERLSYTKPEAWKEVYGHKTAGRKASPKDTRFLNGEANGFNSVLTEPSDAEHGAQRRIFAHAFSDRALSQQDELIGRYVDDLIRLVHRAAAKSPTGAAELDAVKLYNFTTFDIMGDLTFSEPLGNLENSEYSPWVTAIFHSFKAITLIRQLNEYPLLQALWKALMPAYLKKAAIVNLQHSAERVDKRLAKEWTEHPDIWALILRSGHDISREVMNANSILFMLAGTETTATLLSGLTYLLLKNPSKYKRLVEEVRQFESESELTIDSVRHMKYLVACIEEALRVYPPVPLGTFREITRLAVVSWAAFRSSKNFKDPELFLPERWMLDEPGFEKYHSFDKREVVQPFSYGPRNCLGKNLAHYEMRAIMARVLWNFDLDLNPRSDTWIDQNSYLIWDKPELMILFKPRKP